MPIDPAETIYYKQARFTTRLPKGYLYVPSHYWLFESSDGVYRVGLTKFATRMLGDFVEHGFNVQPGTDVVTGQSIGWIEGFKALSDIYCVSTGQYLRANDVLNEDPHLVDADPYDRGWLYELRGTPPEHAGSVDDYIAVLDATIDRMLAEQHSQENRQC